MSSSCYSQSRINTDFTQMDTVFEDLSCRSLKLESTMSSILSGQESSDSIMSLMLEDFIENNPRIQIPWQKSLPGQKSLPKKKQNRLTLKNVDDEKSSCNYLSLPAGTPSPNTIIFSPNLRIRRAGNQNFPSSIKISDQYSSTYHKKLASGLKCTGGLESMSSLFSTSVSSIDEPSNIHEMDLYASPISVCSNSAATDMRECKDRHFFQNNLMYRTANEKLHTPENIPTMDSEFGIDSPSVLPLVRVLIDNSTYNSILV